MYYALNTTDVINPTKVAQGNYMNEEDGALVLRKVGKDGTLAKAIKHYVMK